MFKCLKTINFKQYIRKANFNSTDNVYTDTMKLFFENNIKNKKLPCFEVYSSQIEILQQPMDYYLALIVKPIYI